MVSRWEADGGGWWVWVVLTCYEESASASTSTSTSTSTSATSNSTRLGALSAREALGMIREDRLALLACRCAYQGPGQVGLEPEADRGTPPPPLLTP